MLKSDVTSDASGFFDGSNGVSTGSGSDRVSIHRTFEFDRTITRSLPLPVLMTPSPNAVRRPRDPQAPSHVRTQLLNAATQLGLCLHAKLCSIFRGCWYRDAFPIAFIAINELRLARRDRLAGRARFLLGFLQERLSRFRKG